MSAVLVIDDDAALNEAIRRIAQAITGDRVDGALLLKEGQQLALQNDYDVIFLDLRMPDGNSLDHLGFFKALPSGPEVIIITGMTEADGAETAMKLGVWDYLEKPFRNEELVLTMQRALGYRKEKTENQTRSVLIRDDIIGHSPSMLEVLRQVALASSTDAAVLIAGETGTGKELFSQAIHKNSSRSQGPFVVVDCAALPEALAESLLFGHRKGSFTGAEHASEGLVRGAHRGTLFLDEVGELPLSLQKTFLRVLQEKRFRPIGEKEEVTSDFRLIAATNRDLDDMVQKGLFRQDLLFRLKSLVVDLPALRNRREDLQDLALHFLQRIARRTSSPPPSLTFEFMECLSLYDWPGNVREFAQVMEKVSIAAGPGRTLFPIYLPHEIRGQAARRMAERRKESVSIVEENVVPVASTPFLCYKEFREHTLGEAERQYFSDLMALTGRDIPEACRVSGLSRTRLYEQLRKVGLTREE